MAMPSPFANTSTRVLGAEQGVDSENGTRYPESAWEIFRYAWSNDGL